MALDLIIRGGTVITPDGAGPRDVGVQGEQIAAVAQAGAPPAEGAQVLDATGLVVAPGQEPPRLGLVGRRHDHRPDEVVLRDPLEEVERHFSFRSGRLSASADHSSVAFFLNSMAFSHSSSP